MHHPGGRAFTGRRDRSAHAIRPEKVEEGPPSTQVTGVPHRILLDQYGRGSKFAHTHCRTHTGGKVPNMRAMWRGGKRDVCTRYIRPRTVVATVAYGVAEVAPTTPVSRH